MRCTILEAEPILPAKSIENIAILVNLFKLTVCSTIARCSFRIVQYIHERLLS